MLSARTRLRNLLDRGEAAGGLFLSIPAPTIVEVAAVAGFDFVLIDLEHTLIDGREFECLLAAADRSGISALVRVPDARSDRILQVLDAGAAGIVVPRCSSAEDAKAAVSRARYAPLGSRGLNAGRLGRFGDCDLVEFISRLDRETLIVAMIEDRSGLDAVDDIAQTEGIDAVLLGAADYSQSIGLPWQTTCPEVIDAEAKVAIAVGAAGKQLFVIPRRDEDIERHVAQGALGIIGANDRGILRQALTRCDRNWRSRWPSQPQISKEIVQ
ncbi:HpcH/HpaI aldolase family protein [Agrobacterium tumefaciens]|uniref:HpcH/HpaI aldolase family protein n=1 Tax=Agrobacterium tumefaciens TaxID=358 RepID=UPI001EEECA6F|nr:aldolase/citrate lyase family protein [Agrobacterium tumefaciens]